LSPHYNYMVILSHIFTECLRSLATLRSSALGLNILVIVYSDPRTE
jgi:hypothetical protein